MPTRNVIPILGIICIMILAAAQLSNAQTYPPTITVPVTMYDFRSDGLNNPAFESPSTIPRTCNAGLVLGMVQNTLDAQHKPIPIVSPIPQWNNNGTMTNYPNECYSNLNKWFRYSGNQTVPFDSTIYRVGGQDFTIWSWTTNRRTPWTGMTWNTVAQAYAGPAFNATDSFANYVMPDTLQFTYVPNSAGKYRFERTGSNMFFPIDGRGFGNQGNNHNFSFTMEIHRTFTYVPGMTFMFQGDDDVWCFINKKLVLDIGGVHGPTDGNFTLSGATATNLGLIANQTYDFDFFYCERHTTAANIIIESNIISASPPNRLVLNVPNSQLPAGTIENISASLLDDTGAVVPKSSSYYNHITWQLLDAKDTAPSYAIYTPQALKTTFAASNILPGDSVWVGTPSDKSTASVRSKKAHRVVRLQVTFTDTVNNKSIIATASIFIIPNSKYKITLESDTIPDLWIPDVYTQTTLTTAPFRGSVYAFHRDSLNNLYDLDGQSGQAKSATWQALDAGDTILVNPNSLTNADPNRQWAGVFIRNPIYTLGQARGWVVASEIGVAKSDSLEVIIAGGTPTAIRIVRVDPTGTIIPMPNDSLIITTDDAATLKAQVLLSTNPDPNAWVDWDSTSWAQGNLTNPTLSPALSATKTKGVVFSPVDSTKANATLTASTGGVSFTLKLKVTTADPSFVAIRLLSSASDTPYIAGKPFRVIAEIRNNDGLVPGTWCASNPRTEAIYQDVLNPSSVKGNSATVASTEETGGINRHTGRNNTAEETEHISECFHNGLDTITVTIYNAADNHVLWLLLDGKDGNRLETFTDPFNVLPGALNNITILDEYFNTFPPSGTTLTASDSSIALILKVRGFDAYGNITGSKIISNWDTASNGNLHLPDAHLNQELFNYTTNVVKKDETGCLIATASSNPAIKDTVCLSINAPLIKYTAVTRDGNGNGLLDTIALTFSAPVALSDADINNFTLGNGLVISHIVPKSTNPGTEYYLVLTRNDTTTRTSSTIAQTNMTPSITIRNNSEISPNPVTPIDGAGPVVWLVKEYISGDTAEVHVYFSEPVSQGNATGWKAGSSIKEMFDVYQGGNPPIFNDTALDKATFQSAHDSTLTFTLPKGSKLKEFQKLKIQLITNVQFQEFQIVGSPSAASTPKTAPVANNIGAPVIVIYAEIFIENGPNPFPPAVGSEIEKELVPHNSRDLAQELVTQRKGGTIFDINISPRNGPGETPLIVKTIKATFNVYDVIGNLVYNRSNDDLTNNSNWTGVKPWKSGDSRGFAFYWNGINDRKMACAPGVYRAMIFITVISTDADGAGEYIQRIAPITKVCGIRR